MHATITDLSTVMIDLDRLLGALDDQSGGYQSDHSYERAHVASSPGSSGIDRSAFQADEAGNARRRLETLICRSHDLASEIGAIRTHWIAQGTVGAQPGKGAPGCEIMSTVGVWEPAHLTDAQGNIEPKMMLGDWARRFVIRAGRLPTREEAEAHAQGRKVNPAADRHRRKPRRKKG